MKKLILVVSVASLSFCADFTKAEKAINDYTQTKQAVQLVFTKADIAIQELATVIQELQKENNEKDTVTTTD